MFGVCAELRNMKIPYEKIPFIGAGALGVCILGLAILIKVIIPVIIRADHMSKCKRVSGLEVWA